MKLLAIKTEDGKKYEALINIQFKPYIRIVIDTKKKRYCFEFYSREKDPLFMFLGGEYSHKCK